MKFLINCYLVLIFSAISNSLTAQTSPYFYTQDQSVASQEMVCVDITTQNFSDILTIQFSVGWNPTMLEFDHVENLNKDIAIGTDAIGLVGVEKGYLRFNYFTLNLEGANLEDDAVLFTICLKAIGEEGAQSPIGISNYPLEVEIYSTESQVTGTWANGTISIGASDDFAVFVDGCSDEDPDGQGIINFEIFGGTPPYAIEYELKINPNISGTLEITENGGSVNSPALPVGCYDYIVSDGLGLLVQDSVIVNDSLVSLGQLIGQDLTCSNNADGQITLDPNINLQSYHVSWNNGILNENTLQNIEAGTYMITATERENSHCVWTDSIIITSPAPIAIEDNFGFATCTPGSDGYINITHITGGSPIDSNYNILWSTGSVAQELSGLEAATYAVTIADQNNCSFQKSYDLSEVLPAVSITQIQDILCQGDATGSISIDTSEGNAPIISILWSSGESATELSNLSSGSYTVTIKDELNCEVSDSITLTEPVALNAVAEYNFSTNCIDVTASGGTAPYMYALDCENFTTDPQFCQLNEGSYTLCIVDANGCIASTNFNISSNNSILSQESVSFNNLVKDKLIVNLSFSERILFDLIILDLNLKPVYNESILVDQSKTLEIDLGNAVAGPYFMQIKSSNEIASFPLIKIE